MITLYTALGSYHVTKNGIPSVLLGDRECSLDLHELLVWTTLAFRILTYEELRKEFYERERELHILGERDLDHYLNRLIDRKLVASGRDETGVDALYNLLGRLYIQKCPNSILLRTTIFLEMWLIKRIPPQLAVLVFRPYMLDPLEKNLMRALRHQLLSTAELIQCAVLGRFNIQNSSELLDCLYSDKNTDYKSIVVDTRTMDERHSFLYAVTNLYLKQQITLQLL